jgi:hypothetical protein
MILTVPAALRTTRAQVHCPEKMSARGVVAVGSLGAAAMAFCARALAKPSASAATPAAYAAAPSADALCTRPLYNAATRCSPGQPAESAVARVYPGRANFRQLPSSRASRAWCARSPMADRRRRRRCCAATRPATMRSCRTSTTRRRSKRRKRISACLTACLRTARVRACRRRGATEACAEHMGESSEVSYRSRQYCCVARVGVSDVGAGSQVPPDPGLAMCRVEPGAPRPCTGDVSCRASRVYTVTPDAARAGPYPRRRDEPSSRMLRSRKWGKQSTKQRVFRAAHNTDDGSSHTTNGSTHAQRPTAGAGAGRESCRASCACARTRLDSGVRRAKRRGESTAVKP